MEPGPFTSDWLHCPLSFQTSNLGILPPHHCQTLAIDPRMSLILALPFCSCEHCSLLVLSSFFPAWLWVLYCRVSIEAVIKVSVKVGSHLKAHQGKDWFFLPLVVDRIHILGACWTESFSSLLCVGWRLPSVPCHMGLPNMVTCFIKMGTLRRQGESYNLMEYNNGSGIPSILP